MTPTILLMAIALPSTTLAADPEPGHLELGIGTRDTITEPGHVEGVRAIGRYAMDRWAVELDLYATPTTHRTWRYEDPQDAYPYQEDYIDLDQASAALLLDWGPGYDDTGRWLQLRPHILAGVEARRTVRRYPYSLLCTEVALSYIAVEPSPEWAFGPDLGLGLTLHTGPRVGLRLAAVDRMRVSIEERWLASDVLGNPYLQAMHDLTASADLLVRF
jgi:hypothetical protein